MCNYDAHREHTLPAFRGHNEDPMRFDLFQRQGHPSVLEPGVKLRSFVSESWLYMLKSSPAVHYSTVTF